uniref:Uncharacterized protein n=1 Tax=Anguilla anguilla TaxID=7936 RepID=A0A0E9PYL1_ANGAN
MTCMYVLSQQIPMSELKLLYIS